MQTPKMGDTIKATRCQAHFIKISTQRVSDEERERDGKRKRERGSALDSRTAHYTLTDTHTHTHERVDDAQRQQFKISKS